jgi:hypothetical protein
MYVLPKVVCFRGRGFAPAQSHAQRILCIQFAVFGILAAAGATASENQLVRMNRVGYAPGAMVIVRDSGWLVHRVDRTSTWGQSLSVVAERQRIKVHAFEEAAQRPRIRK